LIKRGGFVYESTIIIVAQERVGLESEERSFLVLPDLELDQRQAVPAFLGHLEPSEQESYHLDQQP
jgi:hypothetical protein